MSGMQDVAVLADRYASLSSSSQNLHGNIDKLKKEVGNLIFSVSVCLFIRVLFWGFSFLRTQKQL
jgi:hypothetical protein